jgi:hypothetical protein
MNIAIVWAFFVFFLLCTWVVLSVSKYEKR